MVEAQDIKDIMPYRYPFLLVDKVIKKEEAKRIVGVKNVTINEPFFQGHFPVHPVMPGVLILEALAQVGAIAVLDMEENKGKIGFLSGVYKCRFKRQVQPGLQLQAEVEMLRMKVPVGNGKAIANVDGETVCEAEITFAITLIL